MDPDPDPASFVFELQDANKKLFKKKICLLLFEGIFTSFFKDKRSKRSHKTVGIQVFLTMIEGSGSGSIPVPQTNGSGSGRPKNMWIRIRGSAEVGSPQRSFVTIFVLLFLRPTQICSLEKMLRCRYPFPILFTAFIGFYSSHTPMFNYI
jgi:hypothetical protein